MSISANRKSTTSSPASLWRSEHINLLISLCAFLCFVCVIEFRISYSALLFMVTISAFSLVVPFIIVTCYDLLNVDLTNKHQSSKSDSKTTGNCTGLVVLIVFLLVIIFLLFCASKHVFLIHAANSRLTATYILVTDFLRYFSSWILTFLAKTSLFQSQMNLHCC